MAVIHLDEQAIFEVARKIEAHGAREAYLQQACRDDAALDQRVRALLKAFEESASFLEVPVSRLARTQDEPQRAGTVIGPYKLLEQIGEGGFGVVFMAEQQEPVRRKVALKILKPGMDTRQVIARFEAERQALALMDHPNIAHVFAGDETATGRPYFVMELVLGIPITDFCDQNQLPIRQRLELFLTVCQAVQHAHQKGIIHRDIKPSNVLVTLHDDKPVVKVIDFGIAKATGQQLTEKTLFTNFAQMIGTPLYMSPEQAQMSGLDVDTRSDIYSLGVLLYELLTGTTPFDKERLKELSYDELRRIIREEEPPKPSTRISTLGMAATTASANRKSDPTRLSRSFRGELDWIVMKALEKDRNRRYETASAFAADVQRYLHDEPVQACPPSAWYRFRKLARRNKAALTTAALVAAALLAGTAAATWQAFRAEAALEEETRQHQRADAHLRLALASLEEIYTDLGEGRLADEPHLEPLRREFLTKALRFFQEFARENHDDPRLRFELGKAYSRVGAIQSFLGQDPEAEEAFHKGIALLQELVTEQPAAEYRVQLAKATAEMARFLRAAKGPAEAEPPQRQALALQEVLVAEAPREPEYRRLLGLSYGNLAGYLHALKRYAEAAEAGRKGLEVFEELVRQYPAKADYNHGLAFALHNLGNIFFSSGKPAEGEKFLRRASDIESKVLTVNPDVTAYRRLMASTEDNLAVVLEKAHKVPEAEQALRRSLKLCEALARGFPAVREYRKHLIATQKELSRLLRRASRAEEGLALFERLLVDFPNAPEYRDALAKELSDHGARLMSRGQWQAAEKVLRRALALGEGVTEEWRRRREHRQLQAACLGNLGIALARSGRPEQAIPVFRQALALRKELFREPRASAAPIPSRLAARLVEVPLETFSTVQGQELDDGERLAMAYLNLEVVFTKTPGHLQDLERMWPEALAALPEHPVLNNNFAWFRTNCPEARFRDAAEAVRHATRAVKAEPKNGGFWNTLGAARLRAGDAKGAVQALNKSLSLPPGPDASDYFFLAMAHIKLGQPKEARTWYDKGIDWVGQNKNVLDRNREMAEQIRRFQGEASELLGGTGKNDLPQINADEPR
jgi:serine/threonine protein kinase/Flp pilus assembly protein TadD